MNTERAETKLIRLLAGVAWADGEVTSEERGKILRIAGEIGLTPAERSAVSIDLERPAGLEATLALGRELLESLPQERRSELYSHLDALVEVDGKVHPEEKRIVEALREARKSDAPALLAKLRGLFSTRGSAGARSSLSSVAGSLLDAIRPEGGAQALDEGLRARAVLFGSILRRVAFADGRVDPAEIAQIRGILEGTFSFDEGTTETILSAVESQAADGFDRQRLCASFNRHSTMEERMQLLGCLFAVAKADGSITDEELRELRLIANFLWIDARDFHQLRAERG